MSRAVSHLARSWLFVPADRPDRAEKAARLAAHVVILELEDGVPRERKDEARLNTGRLMETLELSQQQLAVRINRMTDPAGLDDLRSMPGWVRHPDLIILPKVESGAEVRLYAEYLAGTGIRSALVPSIENARGLLAAPEIAQSTNVAAILFGGGDLSLDLGCRMTWEALLPHRARVVVAGAAAAIPVIDVPFVDVGDQDGLRREAEAARDIGMTGKVCIHPAQIAVINRAFRPTELEVERARRIVAAAASGRGPALVDGRLVDRPLILMAERIVAEVDLAPTEE